MTGDTLPPLFFADALGGLAAGLLFGSLLATGLLVSWRLAPEARLSVRLSATAVVGLWLPVAIFWLLAPWGLFRLPVVLVVSILLTAIAARVSPVPEGAGSRLRQELAELARGFRRSVRRPVAWPVLGLAIVAAVRGLRSAVGPPLGWDSLTYHLLKAGRWVQEGGLAAEAAPDAWSYYEYYPLTGDIYSAWAMLPMRGDDLLVGLELLLWCVVLLGVYAGARELGAGRNTGALVAAAVGSTPSVLAYLGSGYVDTTTLALFSLACVFLIRAPTHPREAPLAAGALGLMLGVKLTMAPVFLLGALYLGHSLLGRGRRRAPVRVWVLALLMVSAGSPSYLRAWAERGSPIYPFGFSIGEREVFEGNETQSTDVTGSAMGPSLRLDTGWEALAYFLYRRTREGAFVNPGPGAILLLMLGLVGVFYCLRRPEKRGVGLFLILVIASLAAVFFSPNNLMSRTTIKASTVGRYLTPGLAALALLGAAIPARLRVRWIWSLTVLAGVVWSWPRGWDEVELRAMGLALPVLALAATVPLLLSYGQGVRRPLRWLGAAVALALSLGALSSVRAAARYGVFGAAARPSEPVFHMHRLHPVYASAWYLWRFLDDGAAHTVAATAGWDGLGHNWYRYPLLGRRLQNRVLYLPVTADGSIVDYRQSDDIEQRASFEAWLQRLRDSEVDFVVSLAPRSTIEQRWLDREPEIFEPVVGDANGFHVAYWLHRDRAEQRLASIAGELSP